MSDFGVVTEAGTVRFERVLPGPIERVWSYLTDSDKRATWLAAGAMDLRPGTRIELTFDNGRISREKEAPPEFQKVSGPHTTVWYVVRCEKPRLLVCTWPMQIGDTEVTFELSDRGKDVVLVLTHRRLDRAMMLMVGPGWHSHLGIMEDRLRGAEPRPFWTTFATVRKEYEKRV